MIKNDSILLKFLLIQNPQSCTICYGSLGKLWSLVQWWHQLKQTVCSQTSAAHLDSWENPNMSSTSQWTTWKSNGLFHLLIQDVSSVSGPSTWPGNKLRILWLPSAKRVSPQNASLSLCILNQLIHIYYKLWKLMSDVLQGWRQFNSFQFIYIPTYLFMPRGVLGHLPACTGQK